MVRSSCYPSIGDLKKSIGIVRFVGWRNGEWLVGGWIGKEVGRVKKRFVRVVRRLGRVGSTSEKGTERSSCWLMSGRASLLHSAALVSSFLFRGTWYLFWLLRQRNFDEKLSLMKEYGNAILRLGRGKIGEPRAVDKFI